MKSIVFIIMFFSLQLLARIQLPTGLDSENRKTFVNLIATSTSYKYLGLGYTLGGYDGLEVSTTFESIPLSKVNYLSNREIDQKDFVVQNLTFGKGMFENVDLFFTFSPFIIQKELALFGMALKYVFYFDNQMPLNLSLFLHGNAVNFANLLAVQSTGADIIGTYFIKYWTLYFAFGQQRTLASFIGGDNGLTAEKVATNEDIYQNRFYSGFSYNFISYQVSFEVEKVVSESFALKVGKRF